MEEKKYDLQVLNSRRACGMRVGFLRVRAVVFTIICVAIWFWLASIYCRELPVKIWCRDFLTVLLWAMGSLASYRLSRCWCRQDLKRCSLPEGRRDRMPLALFFLGALVLFSMMGLVHSPRYFFYGWPVRSIALMQLPKQTMLVFMVLSWAFVPLFVIGLSARWLRRLLMSMLLIGQGVCSMLLLKHTGFSALYSDDHPSFLFRLLEFFGSFPWRENYVPFWNGGVVNSVITSSGIPGYALLGAPLWLLMDPHIASPYVFLFVFVFFVPWMMVWSLRAAGLSWTGALVGGLLTLCGSRLFFIWMLHFGTVGASFAGAMLPPAFVFLYAALFQRQSRRGVFVGLFLSLFLMGQWPPLLLAGLPMGLLVVISWRRWWYSSSRLRIMVTGILVIIALLPTVAGALLGQTVMNHVLETAPAAGSRLALVWAKFLSLMPSLLMDINPLILVAGFAGLWVMPWRHLRRGVVIVLLFLIAVFSIVPVYLPNLQLERLAIMAAGLLVVPAACWLRKVLEVPSPRAAVVKAVVLALLVCSLTNLFRYYANRTPAQYTGVRPSICALTAWMNETIPEDGRLLFAGTVVHAYGRGHIAYLPHLAGREMMACDYYGFPPGMVEPGYPPQAFRKQPGGMARFMRLYGVTHVISFRDNYIDHFRAHPEFYEEVARFEEPLETTHNVYIVFKVKESGGRFFKGHGRVQADFNRITVFFDESIPEEAVIAYNWDDRLRVSQPAQIHAVEVEPGIRFIGIQPNGEKAVEICYRSRF